MQRNDLGRLIVATSEDLDSLPWETSEKAPGVYRKTLWQSGDVNLGIMKVDFGAENPEHIHHAAHHHIWIIDGECTMVGERVGPGSYVYVPPGVPHAVTDVSADGCTFFYTYRPLEIGDHSPLDSEHGAVV